MRDREHVPQCNMGSAEIMTISLVAAFYSGDHIQAARRFLHLHRYIPKMLIHSRLNRPCRLLTACISQTR